MKLRINCGLIPVSRRREKESFNVPAGELYQFEGIKNARWIFFLRIKADQYVQLRLSMFIPLRLPKKDNRQSVQIKFHVTKSYVWRYLRSFFVF